MMDCNGDDYFIGLVIVAMIFSPIFILIYLTA